MSPTLDGKLVVAISSRALFDLESENAVFETGDDGAYRALQLERLDDPPPTGVAYPLVQKLLRLNSASTQPVEVVIASRNDPVSGLRIFRAAKHYGLSIERGIFTRGRSPHRYLAPLNASLFLSANPQDVRAALLAGYPAAQVYPASAADAARNPDEIRIAFDGDAVLFSDQAERVFKGESLARFVEHEVIRINEPLPAGPFKPFLAALHGLQSRARENTVQIRTALVTARSAPAHERAIRTLLHWGIEVDEACFLGGLPKGPFLKAFEPDFFFDDQAGHCESAVSAGPTGQVLYGIANETDA
ncbi:5'-nucleotidase [Niveibacterium microcysteis]|uniref:5'-nucleotidase n=1 Tax=Niveibacterium microcysteis TaxID=2811415 RepID=A0ABX7M1Y7_9RHOO|nr:5'-nucleotidase [Niveibacterium microcysteis]QSI75168.1 5'-nucleotidase [Niveibacterium microcysteis]